MPNKASADPLFSMVSMKGSSAKYMWARKALVTRVCDRIKRAYDLSGWDKFVPSFKDPSIKSTIATLNYDRVIEELFERSEIPYSDGFAGTQELAAWVGFDKADSRVPYLKLHGSLDWFQIRDDQFADKPDQVAASGVYKVPRCDIRHLLKSELLAKENKDEKYKYEFNTQHLIMGG